MSPLHGMRITKIKVRRAMTDRVIITTAIRQPAMHIGRMTAYCAARHVAHPIFEDVAPIVVDGDRSIFLLDGMEISDFL
jgi:hypothetical protein